MKQIFYWLAFLLSALHSQGKMPFEIHIHDPKSLLSEKECSLLMHKADSIRLYYKDHRTHDLFKMDIFPSDTAVYFLPDGTFDVFEYKAGTFTNLYRYANLGYNNLSSKFIYKGQIHSFGGYGFWKHHGQLIYFDMAKGQWEIYPASTNFPFGIYYLYNEKFHLLTLDHHHTLDLSTQEVTTVENKQSILPLLFMKDHRKLKFKLQIFSFGDWTKLEGGYFLHHPTGKIQSEAQISPLPGKSTYLHIKGDSLYMYGEDFQKILGFNTHHEMSLLVDLESDREKNWPNRAMHLLWLAIPGGLLWWFIKRGVKTNMPSEPALESKVQEFIEKLVPKEGTYLTTEEIDALLEIENIQKDETLRSKRAKLINEINQYYQSKNNGVLIVREKDPEDKRRYLYFIKTK
jgi:hypothetical protein